MTNRKIAFLAIPIVTAIMIGGLYITASGSGPSCPSAHVLHALTNSKNAFARYDNTNTIVSFFFGKENCTPDNGPPQNVGNIFIRITDTCTDNLPISKDNFTWNFGYTTLTLDNTDCGDIFVEWFGNGTTIHNSGGSTSGENCHDGKVVSFFTGKSQFANSTLWVNGTIFDTSVDQTDALIQRGQSIFTACDTGN